MAINPPLLTTPFPTISTSGGTPSDPGSCIDLTPFIQNVVANPMHWGGPSDFYLGGLMASNTQGKALVKVGRAPGRYDNTRAIKLLKREVSIVVRLNHQNVAEFLGIAYHGQRPAIVTTWYPHGDAPTFLVGRPRHQRLRVIQGVLKGLYYLHNGNPAIAHGDIRGANILVNKDFEGVLVDFGRSRVIGDERGASEDPEDSLHATDDIRWMGRELVADDPTLSPAIGPTLASDVWAFGCTFYELLLGKAPYSSRGSVFSIVHDIVGGGFPFSEEDAIQVAPEEIWRIVSGCWRPIPGDRPTISELRRIMQ